MKSYYRLMLGAGSIHANDCFSEEVVELKKGRASDAVVGQLLRYMGYVKDELLEEDQMVKGIIIALTDDQRLKRALSLL